MSELFFKNPDSLTRPGRKCPKNRAPSYLLCLPPSTCRGDPCGRPGDSFDQSRCTQATGHLRDVFNGLEKLLFCKPVIFLLCHPQVRKSDEERKFNTEGTKKNSRRTPSEREPPPALPLCDLPVETAGPDGLTAHPNRGKLLSFRLHVEYLGSSPARSASVSLRTCEITDLEAKVAR